ncbi:MAG: TolC family protein [Flavobacteriaceae bacterium]|nr:TolC family protein [Flavobacteriaceae bacterium]
MKNYKYYFTVLFSCAGLWISAQEKLLKDEAVEIALKNNYDIQVSSNNMKIAENNASIYNSNYLPTLGVNAGANYNDNNNKTAFFYSAGPGK